MNTGNSSGTGLAPWKISAANIPAAGALKADLSNKLIEGLELVDKSLARSLWTGAVLRNCRFERVSFVRSDFAGTRFVDCRFVECDFEPNEFRSCYLTRTTFERCRLVGIQCQLSHFDGCVIDDCSFEQSTIRECEFIDTQFKGGSLSRASVTLNAFSACQFDNFSFGDATFLFLQFFGCTFSACKMNGDTVGYSFGLTRADLDALELLYFGDVQEPIEGHDLLDALVQTYDERRWNIGACLLRLNFELEPAVYATRRFARILEATTRLEPRIEWDELTFLVSVFERMNAEGRLPFLAVWEMQFAINLVVARMSSAIPGFGSFAPAAKNVSWRLKMLADAALERLLASVEPPSEPLLARIVMQERPPVPLDALIQAAGGNVADAELVSAEAGSWVEIWQIGLAAFGAIHLTLVTIDTTWEHSTSIYKRLQGAAKSMKSKRAAKKADANADGELATAHDLSSVATAVELAVRNAKTVSEIDPAAVARLDAAVRQLMVMSDKDLQALLGYAHPNVQQVQLKPARPPRTAPRKVAPRPRGRRRRAATS